MYGGFCHKIVDLATFDDLTRLFVQPMARWRRFCNGVINPRFRAG